MNYVQYVRQRFVMNEKKNPKEQSNKYLPSLILIVIKLGTRIDQEESIFHITRTRPLEYTYTRVYTHTYVSSSEWLN